jgi:hypothetical protein
MSSKKASKRSIVSPSTSDISTQTTPKTKKVESTQTSPQNTRNDVSIEETRRATDSSSRRSSLNVIKLMNFRFNLNLKTKNFIKFKGFANE